MAINALAYGFPHVCVHKSVLSASRTLQLLAWPLLAVLTLCLLSANMSNCD